MAKYFLLIVIGFSNICFSQEFILSYRLYVKNNVAVGEEYLISKPMSPREKKENFQCLLSSLKKVQNEEEFLNFHKNEVIECLMQGSMHVKSLEENQKKVFSQDVAYITLPPTYISVILYGDFAKIVIYK